MQKRVRLERGNCLDVMNKIANNSVDLILCDLPYGTTACKWDVVIEFEALWEQYKRIIKKNGAIVLFGDEPFSSGLRMSNVSWYKYDWYWRKSRPSGYVNAKLKPMKDIETISVFSSGMTANGSKNNMPYFPQGLEDCNVDWKRPKKYTKGDKGVNPTRESHTLTRKITKKGYPRQVLDFPNPNADLIHPTQKPVELMEYLIRTYTKTGQVVLDNCMGSGTTGEACMITGRKFIGIELDKKFYNFAKRRIVKAARKFRTR